MMTTLSERTDLSSGDRCQILDLFARFAWAYDIGDANAYADTFSEDAVIRVGEFRVQGRDAICATLEEFFLKRDPAITCVHQACNLVVAGDNRECSVWNYWLLFENQEREKNMVLQRVDRQYSRCIYVSEQWLFLERVFSIELTSHIPWTSIGTKPIRL